MAKDPELVELTALVTAQATAQAEQMKRLTAMLRPPVVNRASFRVIEGGKRDAR